MASRYQISGWPHRPHIFGTAAQVHAVGQISLAYTFLEEYMDGLFQTCMPTDKAYSQRLFHKLNNRERVDLLTAVIKSSGFHSEAKDRLNHLVRCYDICTENRNILMHAAFRDTYKGVLHLSKRSSNNPAIENQFQIPLADLRAVADQIGALIDYAGELMMWVAIRKSFPAKYRGSLKMPPADKLRPNLRRVVAAVPGFGALPDKLPKPRTLSPYRSPAAPPSNRSPDGAQRNPGPRAR